jgi:DNA replication protein DnaC
MHEAEIAEQITALIRSVGPTTPLAEQSCPNCKDGWVLRSGKAFPCECQISLRSARVIPKLYQNARLGDCKAATIARLGKCFANTSSLGVVISGPTGVGKTYLAAAITRALIEAQQPVIFREVSRIYSELRACMKRDESEENILAPYVNVRWLVLDDFGSGALTDFERRYALDLLNRRANTRLRTIVTTNCELQEIADKLDERIASRLSAFEQIVATGEDRRAQRGNHEV